MDPEQNEEMSAEEIAEIEAVEKEAQEMGWLPKDKFKGAEDKWVPANEFVEKAQHVIPIMRANAARLKNDLLTRDRKIDTLQQELQNVRDGVNKLGEVHREQLRQRIAQERIRLKAEFKDAREDNDVDREFNAQEALRALDKSEADLKDTPVVPPTKAEGDFEKSLSQDYKDWERDNPWYGTDKKRSRLITMIAEDLAKDRPDLVGTGRKFFDEATRILNEEYPEDGNKPIPRQETKVESGNPRGSRSSGKSFADLPAEAKRACLEDVEVLVGPNKLFKTEADWKKKYAEDYFADGGN